MNDRELQERIGVFARVMCVAFIAIRGLEFALYRRYPGITPEHYWTTFAIGIANVLVLSATWLVLRRARMTKTVLWIIDLVLMTACGAVFGATAILAANRHEVAYTCLIYACFMVFMRTIVVPSSARRTVVVATLAILPMIVAAAYLALETTQDVPGYAFFFGGALYAGAAVAIAGTGSQVIYGLRRRATHLELGQYTLVRKVGESKSGTVFVARHALLRRATAIKLVEPSRASDFERAVREMSQLRHHNTVAVYDYGRSPDGVFYFAMEYLDGISLDVLHEHGPQSIGRVIAIVRQLCGSLHEAHQRGFAHGNLKPSNVILCERGGLCDVAKLTDFGFANANATAADDLHALGQLARTLIGGSQLDGYFADASSAKQLSVTLRAVDDSWSPANARAWWSDYRRTSAPFLPVPTTLAVDLRRRAI